MSAIRVKDLFRVLDDPHIKFKDERFLESQVCMVLKNMESGVIMYIKCNTTISIDTVSHTVSHQPNTGAPTRKFIMVSSVELYDALIESNHIDNITIYVMVDRAFRKFKHFEFYKMYNPLMLAIWNHAGIQHDRCHIVSKIIQDSEDLYILSMRNIEKQLVNEFYDPLKGMADIFPLAHQMMTEEYLLHIKETILGKDVIGGQYLDAAQTIDAILEKLKTLLGAARVKHIPSVGSVIINLYSNDIKRLHLLKLNNIDLGGLHITQSPIVSNAISILYESIDFSATYDYIVSELQTEADTSNLSITELLACEGYPSSSDRMTETPLIKNICASNQYKDLYLKCIDDFLASVNIVSYMNQLRDGCTGRIIAEHKLLLPLFPEFNEIELY